MENRIDLVSCPAWMMRKKALLQQKGKKLSSLRKKWNMVEYALTSLPAKIINKISASSTDLL